MSAQINRGALYAAAVLLSAASLASADVVLQDNMDYADSAAFLSSWTGVSTYLCQPQSTFPNPSGGTVPVAHAPFIQMGNEVVYRQLPTTLTSSWDLSFMALQDSFQRGLWVGMLDATGTNGYAAFWDSADPDQYNGQGAVNILKISNGQPISSWSVSTTQIGYDPNNPNNAWSLPSGHPALGFAVTDATTTPPTFSSTFADFAQFDLSWTAATGSLVLKVDGQTIITATDTDYSSFSRIYLHGNTNSYFDNVVVSSSAVPEPASLGLIGAGGLLLLRRRR